MSHAYAVASAACQIDHLFWTPKRQFISSELKNRRYVDPRLLLLYPQDTTRRALEFATLYSIVMVISRGLICRFKRLSLVLPKPPNTSCSQLLLIHIYPFKKRTVSGAAFKSTNMFSPDEEISFVIEETDANDCKIVNS